MRLNQSSVYAITAAVQIAAVKNGGILSASKMCEAAKMPDRFVLQILRKMVNAGILKSTRGVKGGYKLAKPANKITIADIVEAADGPIVGEGLEVGGLAPASGKIVDKAIEAMVVAAKRRLAAISLADLKAAK